MPASVPNLALVGAAMRGLRGERTDETGRFSGITGSTRDVTERESLQLDLRKSRGRPVRSPRRFLRWP